MELKTKYKLLIMCISTRVLQVFSLGNVGIIENIAVGKKATQAGSYTSITKAEKCVDGNNDPDTTQGSCCHPVTQGSPPGFLPEPQYQNKPAWWRVDLGQEYDVYRIVMYSVDYYLDYPGRLDNTWIFVSNDEWPTHDSNNICNKIINGQFAIVTKECDYGNQPPPRRGRYVMLQRENGAHEDQYMHLCEIEVFSCAPDYWGIDDSDANRDDCSKQCNCKGGTNCRVKDGFCYSGCEDTWWGTACDRPCHCSSDGICNTDTGDCGTDGCKESYGGYKKCTIELPKLSSRPDVQLDNDGHLTISFNQWTVSQGGSEPVVAYKIQKQQHGTQIWETVFDISHTASVNIAESRITGLLPDTYYRFRIIPLVKDDGHFVDGIPSIPSGFVNTDGQTFTNESAESDSKTGLIVGVVVGGVVLVVIIVVIVVTVYKRNKKSRNNRTTDNRTTSVSTEQEGKNPIGDAISAPEGIPYGGNTPEYDYAYDP